VDLDRGDAGGSSAGAEESIEVRLVTIDLVALDAEDNTVADLTRDDLELLVDLSRRRSTRSTPTVTPVPSPIRTRGGSESGRPRRTSRTARAGSFSPSTTST